VPTKKPRKQPEHRRETSVQIDPEVLLHGNRNRPQPERSAVAAATSWARPSEGAGNRLSPGLPKRQGRSRRGSGGRGWRSA
jgi:hypothetical protein